MHTIRLPLGFFAAALGLCLVGLRAVRSEQEGPPAKPAPNAPEEALATEPSLAKAAHFLDAASLDWIETKKCGTCHTTYPYLMARPALKEFAGSTEDVVRKFFEDRAANWDTNKPRWPTEVVATASVLAYHDAQTTGKLHPITRQALDRMWKLQRPDGTWDWLKCDWPPSEHDDYYGVLIAALGVGAAPDKYAETPAARAGLDKIRAYLGTNPPPSLHHKAFLLWASSYVPDLMPAARRAAAVKELLAAQRPDGGWSLPSLGHWTWKGSRVNDPAGSPSDGYATGLVLYGLSRAGVKADEPAAAKGIEWLRTHQRESGRWFTASYNDSKHHYITNAGTAYAVLALRAWEK